jgi:hypothetical protein
MLNQKDNDFDDLFRRASDKYPLRTDSADWDRMAAALDDPSSALADIQDTDKRRKRRFIWFFLLLPLGGAGYYAWHQARVGHGHAVVTESVAKAPASGEGTKGSGASNGNEAGANSGDETSVNSGDETSVNSEGANGSNKNGGNGTSANGNSGGAGDAKTGSSGSGAGGAGTVANGAGTVANRAGTSGVVASGVRKDANAVKGGNSGSGVNGSGKIVVGKNRVDGGATVSSGRGKSGVGGIKGGIKDAASDGVVGDATNGMVGGGSVVGNGKGADASRVASRDANYPVNRAPISKDYNLTVNVVAPVVAKDSSKVKPKASSKQKSSYLYAGLLAAPDLSTVKFQSMKGVGTTYSLLLGYQFNKRWAVETGVSLDRKRYYTGAEYFKLKPGVIPSNWDLTNLDGTCYMWEIPINVRYNFSQTEKAKWFATAGLSTYLMTRENYTYNYIWWNGSQYGPGQKNWDIRTPSQYWFSIINLSAGYEHRLGGIGNLRIEPYLRVPLSGLGTGKLNILSTGINIGITRRLW